MEKITPQLRERFLRFCGAYEAERERLEAEGVSGKVVAARVWQAALREVPLDARELHLYKLATALHSVNGGELFADDNLTE